MRKELLAARAKGRFAKKFYGPHGEPFSHRRMSLASHSSRIACIDKRGMFKNAKRTSSTKYILGKDGGCRMVTVRPMAEADVERISQLEEETFSMPWSRDAFLEMIRKPDALYYVAELDGRIVGGCGVLMIAGEGNIANVVVEPGARNRGIGGAMLRRLLEDGEQRGLTAFTLEVRVSNAAAIHLYEKLGFFSEGIRPNFYEKPTEDAMIMWKR